MWGKNGRKYILGAATTPLNPVLTRYNDIEQLETNSVS